MFLLQLLELFGGIGSGRIALKRLGLPIKAIDYVEIDQKAVNSYNAMFANELEYITQNVVGWNLRPHIALHGSPCQDNSQIGKRKGMVFKSGTRSALLWDVVKIFEQYGEWKPPIAVWENVPGVLKIKESKGAFFEYLNKMESLGYTNSYTILNAMDFGLPQRRERLFCVSVLDDKPFDFNTLKTRKMESISNFLLPNDIVPDQYNVTQPSVIGAIGKTGELRRATVIKDYAYTITTRQDRTPAQVIYCGNGRYRYLTELECWRLQGYTDEEYLAAESVTPRNGRFRMPLYEQAGNSIPVPVLVSLFEALLECYWHSICNLQAG